MRLLLAFRFPFCVLASRPSAESVSGFQILDSRFWLRPDFLTYASPTRGLRLRAIRSSTEYLLVAGESLARKDATHGIKHVGIDC
jgi:hypothetical protein